MSNLFLLRKEKLDVLKNLRRKTQNTDGERACPVCEGMNKKSTLEKEKYVCPKCGHHLGISAKKRIEMLVDDGSFREMNGNMQTKNPINFPEYEEKLNQYMEKTGLCDALVTGVGKIDKQKVMIAALDSRFLMGSMGTVVGEKLTRAIEVAGDKKLPLVIFSASGGARMQEGLFSLMQMAKTSAAIERFKRAGGLYISVLTHPTTGGVSASFASLGDIILAEPCALIGFAGPRVIEQTIGQTLPEGFQRSEFLEEHGFVDKIVSRREMKQVITTLLRLHRMENCYGK